MRRVSTGSGSPLLGASTTMASPVNPSPKNLRIAHLGTYPPRKCGIATYTQDVVSAVHAYLPTAPPIVVAMTNAKDDSQYGWPVQYLVEQNDVTAYREAARFLNSSGANLLSIQYEHGIFGGEHGIYLSRLLEHLRIPVVATLHTVLPEPSPSMVQAIRELSNEAEEIVVLNSKAIPLLESAYGISTKNVTAIPHGTPDVDISRSPIVREQLGVSEQTVLSTFGLLGPGKGLEHAIEAVAQVADKHPTLHYYILGQTHPGIVRESGETYREGLMRQAADAGIADRVHFVNHYMTLDELCDWLLASDLYVTPYLNPHQIVSGTLAYAVAAGKPVISTPYLHAQELLGGGRGSLTPFNNPAKMAETLDALLSSPERRATMAQSAWEFGRGTTWCAVARRYSEVFSQVVTPPTRPLLSEKAVLTRDARPGRTIHAELL
jgi:glycosyltransferase involved in cell wall biosynthesis